MNCFIFVLFLIGFFVVVVVDFNGCLFVLGVLCLFVVEVVLDWGVLRFEVFLILVLMVIWVGFFLFFVFVGVGVWLMVLLLMLEFLFILWLMVGDWLLFIGEVFNWIGDMFIVKLVGELVMLVCFICWWV